MQIPQQRFDNVNQVSHVVITDFDKTTVNTENLCYSGINNRQMSGLWHEALGVGL